MLETQRYFKFFLYVVLANINLYYNLRQDVVTNCLERRLLKNAAALITKYLASIHYKVSQLLSHIASVRKGKEKGIWTTSPFPFLSNAISQNV